MVINQHTKFSNQLQHHQRALDETWLCEKVFRFPKEDPRIFGDAVERAHYKNAKNELE